MQYGEVARTGNPGNYRTDPQTYFTQPGETKLAYSAENWTRVWLNLETAGPVAVGTKQDLRPVLSGRGRLLPTGEEVQFILPRGSRLYFAAEAVNRVALVTEPIPWLQEIVLEIGLLITAIRKVAGGGSGGRSGPKPAGGPVRRVTSSLFGRPDVDPCDMDD